MTIKEIRELTRLFKSNYYTASTIDRPERVASCESIADLATAIEFFRRDLKRIVSDAVKEAVSTAVKEAVGTLNSDKKPVHQDESAWNDFAETRYGNWEPKEIFPIDDTGKHPIAANTYKGQYRFRAKLSVMGIAYFEEIQGYLTDSPIGEPYQLLVNGKWVECPKNFTAYDFTGLSEDMKLLGLDFQSSPMKALDEAWKKANEPKMHLIDDVKFSLDDTIHFLEKMGVKYLEDIKGYKKLFSDKYKPTYPWCESLFYLNVNGNLVECPEGFSILSWNDILNAMEEYNIPFDNLSLIDNNRNQE